MKTIFPCGRWRVKVLQRKVIREIRAHSSTSGIVSVNFMEDTPYVRRKNFYLPNEWNGKSIIGKKVVIQVETDINRGQIIQFYLQEDLISESKPKPLASYQYLEEWNPYTRKMGLCRLVDPALLDIMDYYHGKKNIQPVKGRVLELSVEYVPSFQGYRACIPQQQLTRDKPVAFYLLPVASQIFKPDEEYKRAHARIQEEPDYGPYIEIFVGNVILSRYYFFDVFQKCLTADFSRMALLDYGLGNLNKQGQQILPRPYQHRKTIKKGGELALGYRGRKMELEGMDVLIGEKPFFIPVQDARGEYRILVYPDIKQYQNNPLNPIQIYLPSLYHHKLVLQEKFFYYFAKELIDRGLFQSAKQIIENFIQQKYLDARYQNQIKWIRGLLKNLNDLQENRSSNLNNPSLISEEDRLDFYLQILADYPEKNEIHDRALLFFRNRIQNVSLEELQKLQVFLLGKLDLNSQFPSQFYFNLAILKIILEFPDKFKPSFFEKIESLLDYQGIGRDQILSLGIQFLDSIPGPLFFRQVKNGGNAYENLRSKDLSYDSLSLYLKEINVYRLLTPLGEYVLGMLSRFGDEEARKQMIQCNLKLVVSIAKNFQGIGFPLLDLIGYGNEGLLNAVDKFDLKRGNRFSTFAYGEIEGAILRNVNKYKNQIRLPINVIEEISQFSKLCIRAGLDPENPEISSDEIAIALNMDVDKVNSVRGKKFVMISINKPIDQNDQSGDTLDNFIGRNDSNQIWSDYLETLKRIIQATVQNLRNRKVWQKDHVEEHIQIFKLRFLSALKLIDFLTEEEVGQRFGITRERVRQIEDQAYDALRRVVKQLEIGEDDLTKPEGAPLEDLDFEKFFDEAA